MTVADRDLDKLEQSLLGMIAAITQTPSKNVKKARLASNIATAKVTSIATSASIFGLVSTLGTAGTGTAIFTLSGAASTSATLAWIGGLVGGGMAAGAILLPVAGIAAGTTASMLLHRKLHGKPRRLTELLPFEDEILFSLDHLIRPLDGISKGTLPPPTKNELRIYAHDGLKPLVDQIDRHLLNSADGANRSPEGQFFNATILPKYLKQVRRHRRIIGKYAAAFAKHERKSATERFGKWAAQFWVKALGRKTVAKQRPQIASVAMVVTFQRLLDDQLLSWSLEQDLVLSALRRSTSRLENASISELSDYVKGLNPEQLTGVVSNTKGIYHEMLFVEMHNSGDSEASAHLMEATNFPGADVQFLTDGELIREVQLKAISSPALVYEHLQRYPDVEILVTEEVASVLDGINSSGLKNAVLSKDVTDRLSELQGEGLFDEISDGIITSAFVTSGVLVWSVFKNKGDQTVNFKPYLANAGIAAGTATLIDGAIALIGN